MGETFSPMVASIIAICVNLTGNYLLIYGSFGFPEMGVAGAALATVIARWVEMGYLLLRTYRHRKQFPFLEGLFRDFRSRWTCASASLSPARPCCSTKPCGPLAPRR